LTVLVAGLAFGLGSRSMLARADSLTPSTATTPIDYTLLSSVAFPTPAADIAGPQVQALVLPPGGVVPPTSSGGAQESPLTILPGSHGFDEHQLVVALKNTTSASGQPEQRFGLVFFGQGLAADGVLNFSLSVNKAFQNDPPQLRSLTPGVTITLDPNMPPGGTSPSSGPIPERIPEPATLLLWSIATGAALWKGRVLRFPVRTVHYS
jgi:hypothetical protein